MIRRLDGFVPRASAAITAFLPAGTIGAPILCVSDTHLHPERVVFSDDAPDALLFVLRSFPEHRVFVLGDFIESLALSKRQALGLGGSRRLAPVFDEILRRPGSRVIAGNHDARVVAQLAGLFGEDILVRGSLRLGDVVFQHGHEAAEDLSWLAGVVGRFAIPAAVTIKRLGLDLDFGVASNEIIARASRSGSRYPIFGHTHKAEVTSAYANSGCFLRAGQQSFLLLEEDELTLFARGRS